MSFQPAHKPIDQLVQNDRVLGASRVIRDNEPAANVTEELRTEACRRVLDYIEEKGISRSAVGRSIGISTTVISQVLNGNYLGNWQQITIDLDLWLEQQLKRDESGKPGEFVWTGVALEIQAVANVASTLKGIGLLFGPQSSGMGKSTALRAIAASKPGAVVVTLAKVDSSAAGMLHAIETALEIHTSGGGGARGRFKRIKERLAGTSRMLLIDQIHTLCHASHDKPLFTLTDLFDATGAPQLWCGTSDLLAYLNRGQAHGEDSLAQIRRRICIARDLCERTRPGDGGDGEPLYTEDEIRRVFARGKMRLSPCAMRYLSQLANTPDSGALGTAANLLAMATALNERTATALTADMLKDAHRMLVSRGTFAATENAMHETPARQARTA